ncbi:uncharacterized protein LOC132798881 isoform X1 [Drosophila nasuta]|uniref:uncharacterized protein LOC132798881 isoform X1 n=2 Tax=Drosophila nasuta TaxID=42062 RepID=UPI00295E4E17|nr:uncharacterized protein LOC132798881 isoform X1 [Drosophila nasuta]
MLLLHCPWIALLPLAVLGQTYYINFVFNNNRYAGLNTQEVISSETKIENESNNHKESASKSQMSAEQEKNSAESRSREHHTKRPQHKSTTKSTTTKTSRKPEKTKDSSQEQEVDCSKLPSNTDEECVESDQVVDSELEKETEESGELTTTTRTTTATPASPQPTESTSQSKEPFEPSATPTPHPPEFFAYPQAECHEEMNLHELFGIQLLRDRGLPSKVLCEFANSWGGPWLLMNRIELPTRVHMRHWFFGYITEDYKDMNINLLALAHIINNMRLAMLIIGQDNNNQLVYNLYDDFVISGFNDLFMLRKAHLVEANTTDLMFISVGEVLISDPGRNRSCPFRVLGAWWGPKWDEFHQGFCVFPVERDVRRPGYIAFFIKPSPFEVNNTAFYSTAVTTRRPWVTTADPLLMAKANNDRMLYKKLKAAEFLENKKLVKNELIRREARYKSIEEVRRNEEKNHIDVGLITTTDQGKAKI